mmetsp:Transcript_18383/g.47084  ORF Transcript_18383/g.47084 Transcript_18383/m.47084 type:complete len:277 (+) Transcript_18383:616-1446(+)
MWTEQRHLRRPRVCYKSAYHRQVIEGTIHERGKGRWLWHALCAPLGGLVPSRGLGAVIVIVVLPSFLAAVLCPAARASDRAARCYPGHVLYALMRSAALADSQARARRALGTSAQGWVSIARAIAARHVGARRHAALRKSARATRESTRATGERGSLHAIAPPVEVIKAWLATVVSIALLPPTSAKTSMTTSATSIASSPARAAAPTRWQLPKLMLTMGKITTVSKSAALRGHPPHTELSFGILRSATEPAPITAATAATAAVRGASFIKLALSAS